MDGQAEHVRLLVLEAPLIRCPLPHVVCAVHEVLRCGEDIWYLFPGHDEHPRFAVLESALISCPFPHVACAVHDV